MTAVHIILFEMYNLLQWKIRVALGERKGALLSVTNKQSKYNDSSVFFFFIYQSPSLTKFYTCNKNFGMCKDSSELSKKLSWKDKKKLKKLEKKIQRK